MHDIALPELGKGGTGDSERVNKLKPYYYKRHKVGSPIGFMNT